MYTFLSIHVSFIPLGGGHSRRASTSLCPSNSSLLFKPAFYNNLSHTFIPSPYPSIYQEVFFLDWNSLIHSPYTFSTHSSLPILSMLPYHRSVFLYTHSSTQHLTPFSPFYYSRPLILSLHMLGSSQITNFYSSYP